MEILLFKYEKSFDKVAELVYTGLGFADFNKTETSFNLVGYYYKALVLGLTLKLDLNNYDYEDEYNYMITIRESIGTLLHDVKSIRGVSEIIASLLCTKMKTDVAIEIQTRMTEADAFTLEVFSFDGEKILVKTKGSLD